MLLICSCFHPRPSSVPAGTRSPQGDAAATECRASGTRRSVRSPVLRYLLTCLEIWLRAVLFFWLLYYFFVYCKSFNVLFFGRRFIAAENLCKINTSFWHIQIFNKVFFVFAPDLRPKPLPFLSPWSARPRKRVQNYCLFLYPPNIFGSFFWLFFSSWRKSLKIRPVELINAGELRNLCHAFPSEPVRACWK